MTHFWTKWPLLTKCNNFIELNFTKFSWKFHHPSLIKKKKIVHSYRSGSRLWTKTLFSIRMLYTRLFPSNQIFLKHCKRIKMYVDWVSWLNAVVCKKYCTLYFARMLYVLENTWFGYSMRFAPYQWFSKSIYMLPWKHKPKIFGVTALQLPPLYIVFSQDNLACCVVHNLFFS